jgi:hypothetical protein
MKDWCNEDGAQRLKSKIEEYWTQRGFEVNIDLVDAGFVAAMRSARTDVRSNMVNGMPCHRMPSDVRGMVRRPASTEALLSEAA